MIMETDKGIIPNQWTDQLSLVSLCLTRASFRTCLGVSI